MLSISIMTFIFLPTELRRYTEKRPFCLTTNDCSEQRPLGAFSACRITYSRIVTWNMKHRAESVSAERYLGRRCLLVMPSLCSTRCGESHSQQLPWSQAKTHTLKHTSKKAQRALWLFLITGRIWEQRFKFLREGKEGKMQCYRWKMAHTGRRGWKTAFPHRIRSSLWWDHWCPSLPRKDHKCFCDDEISKISHEH